MTFPSGMVTNPDRTDHKARPHGPRRHTGGVDEKQWREEVQAAVLREDAAALRDLYRQAQALFGSSAGERWAEALSAFDAYAVTG